MPCPRRSLGRSRIFLSLSGRKRRQGIQGIADGIKALPAGQGIFRLDGQPVRSLHLLGAQTLTDPGARDSVIDSHSTQDQDDRSKKEGQAPGLIAAPAVDQLIIGTGQKGRGQPGQLLPQGPPFIPAKVTGQGMSCYLLYPVEHGGQDLLRLPVHQDRQDLRGIMGPEKIEDLPPDPL